VEGDEHFAIPPNADGPILADMGLYIEEIPKVNEIANTFSVGGNLDFVWCDPRLKYDDKGRNHMSSSLKKMHRKN